MYRKQLNIPEESEMSQKIAVAVIHGIGTANPKFADKSDANNFASGIKQKLEERVADILGEDKESVKSKIEFEVIYWAPILQNLQNELWHRLELEQLSNPFGLRNFVFDSLADSIGYQITPSRTSPNGLRREVYDDIHQVVADTLKKLAETAGPKAPLCIIGHSLGSVIANNYIWDLQNNLMNIEVGNTPLEKGETLSLLYTFGSQITLWRLRYEDFGTPIQFPAKSLSNYYPTLAGEWINFYDKDDVLGYPIKAINDKYKAVVTADIEVNAGGILTNWTPLCHNSYWTDEEVINPIAEALVKTWKNIN